MEAIYDDVPQAIWMLRFAPRIDARGPMFGGAAHRIARAPTLDPVVPEQQLYGE